MTGLARAVARHYRAGFIDSAHALCPDMVAAAPDDPAVRHLAAVVAAAAGAEAEALAHAERARAGVTDDDPDLDALLGHLLRRAGRAAEAEAPLRRAAHARPPAALDLAWVLHALDRPAEGAAVLEDAPEAAAAPDRLNALGVMRLAAGAPEAAAACLRDALVARPDDAVLSANLAGALIHLGAFEAARDHADAALARAPDDAPAHCHRALASLGLGDYRAGFAEWAWRWRNPHYAGRYRRIDLPPWDGGPVQGGRLWVRGEEGFGDHIQFSRFVPAAARAAGAPVSLSCSDALHRLFAGIPGVGTVRPLEDPPPDAACQVPLMTLAQWLDVTRDAVPPPDPAILSPAADAPPVPAADAPRVGMVWGGRRRPRDRGCAFRPLADVLRRHGVALVSLQKGGRVAEAAGAADVTFLGGALRDFADTAAVMGALDLVVAVDSAPLHLAGALGVPAVGLMLAGADWRWETAGPATPWYPSVRLVRQPAPGDWPGAFTALDAVLAGWRAGAGLFAG